MISLSTDQTTITIHFYNSKSMDYADHTSINMGGCKVAAANVIPAKKYKLAVLCTENPTYEYIKLISDVGLEEQKIFTLSFYKLRKGSQPLFIDLNSDSYVDIIFNAESEHPDNNIRVGLFNHDTELFEESTFGFFEKYLYENANIG
mmetsp:Transcript_19231/g.22253  ORF Transcript_19231/g.22253 Transcript_19231/m.22253 type:complete len:147 (-) Transcript_19231:757-1197(-)